MGIILQAVAKAPLLGAAKDWVPPVFTFGRHYRVHIGPCVEPSSSVAIYTDGSQTKTGTGAGVFSPDLKFNLKLVVDKLATVFKAEVLEILHGNEEILARSIKGRRIVLYSDRQTASKAFSSYKIASGVVLQSHNALEAIAVDNDLILRWVKGHKSNLERG